MAVIDPKVSPFYDEAWAVKRMGNTLRTCYNLRAYDSCPISMIPAVTLLYRIVNLMKNLFAKRISSEIFCDEEEKKI